jgi:uncharacterized repeat protein (TIGR03837 family)
MHWDIFCRVIDNFGDIGVCWRLAADLAARGDTVRLWVDDASALAWMAPGTTPGVDVCVWPADDDTSIEPREAVVEAFGCHLPSGFVRRMAAREPPPRWINLEYLSAEDYVERSHGLPSPQLSGPARGLSKWFFYPGFTERTGGLLRECNLAERQAAFHATAWLRDQGIVPAGGERVVSLFCYANPALPALIAALSSSPTLLLVTTGIAARQVRALVDASGRQEALRIHYLPALTQADYDHLLWSCDLNLVRGEDSFVRAQWAGRPFLWQIYPQQDGVHAAKLAAFNHRFLESAVPELAAAVARAALDWNGLGAVRRTTGDRPGIELPVPELWEAWRAHCRAWRARLEELPDLTASLRAFVQKRR